MRVGMKGCITMTITRMGRRGLRATLLSTVATIVVWGAAATLVPGAALAHEQCLPTKTGVACVAAKAAPLSYTGWTFLELNPECPPGLLCTQQFAVSKAAWRWTGAAWVNANLAEGWTYVAPYSGQWRWAWTPTTGWVAVSGGRFELR